MLRFHLFSMDYAAFVRKDVRDLSVIYSFWVEFLGLCHKSGFGSHAGRMFSIVNHGAQF